MTEQHDLLKRLRERVVARNSGDGPFFTIAIPDPDCAAAADRIEALEIRQRVLREALEPFAIVGQLFHDSAGDTQWREAPLFFCGTKADPQSHTLTGKAFDRARRALAGDAG